MSSDSREVFKLLSDFEEAAKKLIAEKAGRGVARHRIEQDLERLAAALIRRLPPGMSEDLVRSLYANAQGWLTAYMAGRRRSLRLVKRLSTTVDGREVIAEVAKSSRRHSLRLRLDDKTLQEVFRRYGELEEQNKVHGFIGGPSYRHEIAGRVEALGRMDAVAKDAAGKRRVSLYAKAEREIRYDQQLKMIAEARASGNPLQWISSHADCSKRCAPWQGKLVHLSAPAINSRFETGLTVDGYTVYSFEALTSKKDERGHTNNVIVGYNCRHFLIPYRPGSHPPARYREETIKTERAVTARQRRMEKTIRQLKYQYEMLKDVDPEEAKRIFRRRRELRKEYIEYSKAHNAAFYPWRLT